MSLVEMFLNLKVSVGMCVGNIYLFSQNVEAPKATVAFRASKKPITPVKGLILSRLGYCYTIEAHHLKLLCQNW